MAIGHTFFIEVLILKYLSSKDNPYIKRIAKLKYKKYREKEKLFIIEGEKSVSEALAKKDLLVSVLFDAGCEQYQDWPNKAPDIEWYQLQADLIDYLSDTENPQGILAVAKIPDWDPAMITGEQLLICLDGVSDPGNVGTIIRTGWAMGADGILMTSDCADPYSPKVVRASMGGVLNIPIYMNYPLDHLISLKSKGYLIYGSSLKTENIIYGQDFTGAKIFVIGNESRGISNKSEKLCDMKIKIPINPQVDSLNAAIACAIILAEAWQQRYKSS